jgi:hypothetical protein
MLRSPSAYRRAVFLALAGLSIHGCGATQTPRFPFAQVVWEDDDRRAFSPTPAEYYSPYMWDGAENTFFRPASEFWLFEPSHEAINVNAVDEVPNSSWYTNRLSRRLMTPEEVADAACGADFSMPTPWTIVAGKPDGAYPGFTIRDANGARYLFKPEGQLQHWRPAAAEAIAAGLWHATGYHTSCNRVVHFDPSDFELDPEAMIERTNGSEEPLRESHVREVLDQAWMLPDGRYRASVSRFIDGRPISPWRYEGMRDDDPNDVIPHEHRREVRGMYVLTAWADHVDSRQENTLEAWVDPADSGEGYVRHYVIDFGDCFGVIHPWDAMVRRIGHSGYLDFEHVIVDFLTLGVIQRPWFEARYGDAGQVLGYYDVERFVPDQWRPGYPNPAFDQRTERDAAWMARIIARLRDPHLEALVGIGEWLEPVHQRELVRILSGRRDRILERYLTRLSPLTWPEVRAGNDGGLELCMQDLAVWSSIRSRRGRRYSARAWIGERLEETSEAPRVRLADDAYVCTRLPQTPEASGDRPAYVIVDVIAQTPGQETTGPARAHLYATSEHAMTLVGLERPASAEAPTP